MTNQISTSAVADPNHRELRASQERATQYEVGQVHQGPNSFGLVCTERGIAGSAPIPIDVSESLFTDDELKQVHDALGLLETKFAIAHKQLEDELEIQGLKASRAKVHAFVAQADEAKKQLAMIGPQLEEMGPKLQLAMNVHAQLDASMTAKKADQATLDKAIADMAAHADATEAALTAKTEELQKLSEACAKVVMDNQAQVAAQQAAIDMKLKAAQEEMATAVADAKQQIAEAIAAKQEELKVLEMAAIVAQAKEATAKAKTAEEKSDAPG